MLFSYHAAVHAMETQVNSGHKLRDIKHDMYEFVCAGLCARVCVVNPSQFKMLQKHGLNIHLAAE